jgi:hypothetical protein
MTTISFKKTLLLISCLMIATPTQTLFHKSKSLRKPAIIAGISLTAIIAIMVLYIKLQKRYSLINLNENDVIPKKDKRIFKK